MKITKNEVLHVADLARLDLDEESIDRFAGQIGEILEYVDTLNKLDTKGITPTSHAIFLTNAFREDEKTRAAAEREFIVIGEAAGHIPSQIAARCCQIRMLMRSWSQQRTTN